MFPVSKDDMLASSHEIHIIIFFAEHQAALYNLYNTISRFIGLLEGPGVKHLTWGGFLGSCYPAVWG